MSVLKQLKLDYIFYCEKLKIESPLKALLYLVFFHPGFQLTCSIRIQRSLSKLPLFGRGLRRVVWYLSSIWTATEVSMSAKFGKSIYFPHPTGVVIGDNWDIGDAVTIMQGVTLGRKDSRIQPSERSTLGRGVIVSSGAKLIGELSIGDFSIIGANAVVVKSVPANVVVGGVPAKILKDLK